MVVCHKQDIENYTSVEFNLSRWFFLGHPAWGNKPLIFTFGKKHQCGAWCTPQISFMSFQ